MKAIGAIRVSTEEQSKDGVSLEMQAESIRAYCVAKGFDLQELVEDNSTAKFIKGRPGFQRALDQVLNNGVEALIVWRLDRAFRNTREALDAAQALREKGKHLISVTENIDTTSAFGEFFFTLTAALAQLESRQTGERTAACQRSLRAHGKRYCKSISYGYMLDKDGKSLIENPDEQTVITRARALAKEGLSVGRLCGRLKAEGYEPRDGKRFGWKTIKRVVEIPNT